MAPKKLPVPPAQPSDAVDLALVSAVAHDLKAPLSAVRGFIELMEHAGPFNHEQKRLSDRAFGALEHMQDIINSLVDLARLENGEALDLQPTDMVALLHRCVDLVQTQADKQHISLHVDAPVVLSLACDSHLMQRVLVNLLSNAVKYNREGGEVHVRMLTQGAVLRVDIQDTGEGIPEDEQERVFERFYRSRRIEKRRISGSGLGLAIVKMVIDLHNGHVWLKSVPGQGSTFSFTLPKSNAVDANSQRIGGFGRRGVSPDRVSGLTDFQAAREDSDAVDDDTQEGFSPAEREPRADQE